MDKLERTISRKNFDKLELKYTKLCQKHHNLLNRTIKYESFPQAVIDGRVNKGLYILRIKSGATSRTGIIYLKSTKIRKGSCDICGKRRKTLAHHIVPARLKSVNKELSQIRIRACSECEKKIHPENGYDTNKLVERLNKTVKKLNLKISSDKRHVTEQINIFFDNRINSLKKTLHEKLLETPPKERAKLVLNLGKRMEELQFIRKATKEIVINAITSLKSKNG